MGRAKEISVRIVNSKTANEFVKKHHYSGKVVQNSILHFGAFLNNILHGIMSFGSPLDKRKVLGLVEGTKWNEMLELNRMAFDETLPRNSESRCLSIAFKLIKKNAPHIKWVLSFADGTQSGDGCIYRASGFVLTSIKINNQIYVAPTKQIFSRTSLTDGRSKQQQSKAVKICRVSATKGSNILETGASSMKSFIEAGFKPMQGFQLRYIYLIDKSLKITCPILPFKKIDELGARMYKGIRGNSLMAERQSNQIGGGVQSDLAAQLSKKRSQRESVLK